MTGLWILFLFPLCSSLPLTFYENAQFVPNDPLFLLTNISSIQTWQQCACRCFNSSMCLTATYSGINQRCTMYFASLNQGQLRVMTTTTTTSVLSFNNKTLPDPILLTNASQNATPIWNTTAGQSSYLSVAGSSAGCYLPGDYPSNVFDGDTLTRYANYGECSSTYGSSDVLCGRNTGFYLTLNSGISFLVAFRIATASTYAPRDPITVVIEGSNQPTVNLTFGSSWTMIYNGSSGLAVDPGGQTFGVMEWLATNSIWYASYRVLVTSKRSVGNYVHFSEIELYGY